MRAWLNNTHSKNTRHDSSEPWCIAPERKPDLIPSRNVTAFNAAPVAADGSKYLIASANNLPLNIFNLHGLSFTAMWVFYLHEISFSIFTRFLKWNYFWKQMQQSAAELLQWSPHFFPPFMATRASRLKNNNTPWTFFLKCWRILVIINLWYSHALQQVLNSPIMS